MFNRRLTSSVPLELLSEQFKFYTNQFLIIIPECCFVAACALLLRALRRFLELAGPSGLDKLSLLVLETIFLLSMLLRVGWFAFAHSRKIIAGLASTGRRSLKAETDSTVPDQIEPSLNVYKKTADPDKESRIPAIDLLPNSIEQPSPSGPTVEARFFKRYNPPRKSCGGATGPKVPSPEKASIIHAEFEE